ncbi:unnamed protein product [Toxocara canis]|uniref:RBR-type E3 ubiquitin transferase n=2 Tax=Toxocara canis TaxID=6265 RepID=A0A3P7GUA4_TOXCA|nr:unnamed protein product [Toxocara canis]
MYKHGCRWHKRNKIHAVEFATVRDGEEIHKYANHANRYDFVKKQGAPRKGRKTRWSRNEIIYEPAMNWSSEIQLHVLYKTTTYDWDRRVRNKCDKKVAREKRKSRMGFVKKSDELKVVQPEDAYDESDYGNVEYDGEECLESSPVETRAILSEIAVVIGRTPQKRRHRTIKKCYPNLTAEYEHWLYSAPREQSESTGFSRSESEDSSGYETTAETNEGTGSRLSGPDPLPFFVVPISKLITLRSYVLSRFPSAETVKRFQPETFLTEVSNEVLPETSKSTEFSGFISIHMDDSCSEMDEQLVRLTLNSVTERQNNSVEDEMHLPTGSTTLCCNVAKILPRSIFSEADCLNESIVRKQIVKEWLATANMDLEVDEAGPSVPSNICKVCFGDDQDGFSLHCGHYFCAACWALNVQRHLSTGIVPIRCMSVGCGAMLEPDHALTFVPYDDCMRYERLLWNKLVMREGWMYCDDCGCVIRPRPSPLRSRSIVLCECGAAKCLACRNSFHAPMPCRIAQLYCDVLRSNGEEMERAISRQSLMLRRCPQCRSCCERTEGCNHMQCRCGFEFCYACGKRFDGSHYECENIVLERVLLFDVHGSATDEILQAIYEDSWEYREQRMPCSAAKLRRQLNKISSGFGAFADIYIAAMEVLELSEATLQFLKKTPNAVASVGRLEGGLCKRDDRISRMSNCIIRLKFAVERFRLAIGTKTTKTRIERLSSLIEASAKDLIANHHGSVWCSRHYRRKRSVDVV